MAKKPAMVVLLSGGNPQIAKADGAAPVRASIAAMPGWKRDVGRRLDRLISKTVPGVCKAVKWNSPLYGIKGHGNPVRHRLCGRHKSPLAQARGMTPAIQDNPSCPAPNRMVRVIPPARAGGLQCRKCAEQDWGRGYFLGYHCLTKYVEVAFFRGADLKPMPPGASKQKDVRYFDIYEDTEIDEGLMAAWIRQASELPGWVP